MPSAASSGGEPAEPGRADGPLKDITSNTAAWDKAVVAKDKGVSMEQL